MNNLINVPEFGDKAFIRCKFNKEANNYYIYKSNKYNGEPSMSIGEICATSKESIASDISHALISMQKIGFEQGRKYVRDALGIIK